MLRDGKYKNKKKDTVSGRASDRRQSRAPETTQNKARGAVKGAIPDCISDKTLGAARGTVPAADTERRFGIDMDADSGRTAGADADSLQIEGRNACLEAFRSGRAIDKLMVLENKSGRYDTAIGSILRLARAHKETKIEYVTKQRLDKISLTGRHQGTIAFAAACGYADVKDILERARSKGEQPFVLVLDGIEDPHNLGAIIRTANLAGAHGVIIRADRAAGLTATVQRASAGAVNYTPVAKVTNITQTIEDLKSRGMWFVCADMGGSAMYDVDFTGAIGLVIGNEGRGVSELVRKHCDMTASIPMFGDIDSLNASVAAGVLAYEAVRQRMDLKTAKSGTDASALDSAAGAAAAASMDSASNTAGSAPLGAGSVQ